MTPDESPRQTTDAVPVRSWPRRHGLAAGVILGIVVLAISALVVALGVLPSTRTSTQMATPLAVRPEDNRPVPTDMPRGLRSTPVAADYHGCPPEGEGTDPALNLLRNRTDVGVWQSTKPTTLLAMPWPPGIEKRPLAEWSAVDRARVEPYLGVPVELSGYLLAVRPSAAAQTNCNSPVEISFKLWLGERPDSDLATESIVVVITPRMRESNPEWRLWAIDPVVRDRKRVLIRGWTLLDPYGIQDVGQTRGTVWEIHPLMQVRVDEPRFGRGYTGLGE